MQNDNEPAGPQSKSSDPAKFDKEKSRKDEIAATLKKLETQSGCSAASLYQSLKVAGIGFENEIEFRQILGQMIDAGAIKCLRGGKMSDFDRMLLAINAG